MASRTSLWAEVIDRRRAWHEQDGADSMETWDPADRAWTDRLQDVTTLAIEARNGHVDVDPRAALIDVIAVASAWTDRMGEPTT